MHFERSLIGRTSEEFGRRTRGIRMLLFLLVETDEAYFRRLELFRHDRDLSPNDRDLSPTDEAWVAMSLSFHARRERS